MSRFVLTERPASTRRSACQMVDAVLEQNPLYRVLQAVRRVTEQEPLEFTGTKLFMDDEDVKKCRLRVFIAHTRSYVQELGWDSFYQSAQMVPVELLEAAGESIGAEPPHNGGDVETESGNTIGFHC